MLTERDLATRVGPVLSDGTTIRDLIDLERREVSMRVLNDPEIHRLELRRIFAREWIGVGLECEIPNAGDFVLRHIGEDPVIVTRDRDGGVNVLLNVCAHRGMEVCWADAGNQSQFKCPYHGWVFDSTGALLGAPFEQEMYGDWDKSQYGLRAARVTTRHGLIFANWDEHAIPLDEWMGDFLWYFDQMLDGLPEMESIGVAPNWITPGNWKTSADQGTGDGYHTLTLHQGLIDMGFTPGDNRAALIDNVRVSSPLGHGILSSASQASDKNVVSIDGSDGRYAFDKRLWFFQLFPGTHCAGSMLGSTIQSLFGITTETCSIGGLVPKGDGGFVSWVTTAIAKDTPEETKAMMRRGAIGGVLGADDWEAFPSIQRAAAGAIGQEQTLKYNTLLGVNKPDGWRGPGDVHAGFAKDDNQWNFWLRWFTLMTD